ncbi:MAG: metallophosphoesterase [Deltaproteobacteria bacterium]|nr:metallophosphoesterase [Deltaproteobacteria bacterium]
MAVEHRAAPAVRTLVVSDLHLHAGADPSVAADFARLLDSQRACLLVLNGDVFDLDRVAGERGAGVGSLRAASRAGCILDRFPEILACLRRWAARGGRVVWLPGNHDAELCQPAVRREILDRLGPHATQLRFEDEAYAERGIHIEHGHQHDPDNRFEPTTREAVAKERLSALPLGCLTTRFLLCRIPDYSNEDDNHKRPLSVLLRVLRDHGWSTPGMVWRYFLAGLRIAHQARLARRRLDAPPASTMASPWRVAGRMYLDRIVLTGALASLMLLGIFVWPGLLGACLPCAAILLVPAPRGQRYRFRDRQGCREAAAARIRRGARIAIMGHTHHEEMRADGRGVYLNPGAFYKRAPAGRPYVAVEGGAARLAFLPREG